MRGRRATSVDPAMGADVVEEDLVAVQKLKDNSNVPRDGERPQPS
jgi:hypothetical protein